jgi:hypothetical protein
MTTLTTALANAYPVHKRLAVLDSAFIEQERDIKALRAEVAGLKEQLTLIIDANVHQKEYLVFLKKRHEERVKAHQQ